MKTQILLILIVCFSISCSQSKDVQSSFEKEKAQLIAESEGINRKDLPYQQFSPSIQFLTPKEKPGKTMQQLINEQKLFISKSGLPDITEINSWVVKHSYQDATNLYFNYIQTYKDHEYISTFKQYGGWLILNKLKLLSTTNMSLIASVTETMADGKYPGYGLLYSSLEYLKNNNYSTTEVKRIAKTILSYSTSGYDYNQTDPNSVKVQGLPPNLSGKIEESVKNHYIQKKEEQTLYLTKIQALAAS